MRNSFTIALVGKPKVNQFHHEFTVDLVYCHILGFDVAVDNFVRVEVGECLQNLVGPQSKFRLIFDRAHSLY